MLKYKEDIHGTHKIKTMDFPLDIFPISIHVVYCHKHENEE